MARAWAAGNDAGFLNSDAGLQRRGGFEALPYWSVSAGLTHRWCAIALHGDLRYVNLDTPPAVGHVYHTKQYASANLVWQMRKRLASAWKRLWPHGSPQGVDSGATGATIGHGCIRF